MHLPLSNLEGICLLFGCIRRFKLFFQLLYSQNQEMYLLLAILLQLSLQANITILTFTEWKVLYNKTYANATEDSFRQQIYGTRVEELLNSTCEWCGITKFTADTTDEINSRSNLLLPPNIQELARKQETQDQKVMLSTSASSGLKLSSPSSLDWRDQGAVTSVKAQGTCGTCWSFATVGMSESSLILQGKAFNNRIYSVNLSEQYLLKCTPGSSCNGGYLQNSIDKALEKGLPYESSFSYSPYSASNNGICSTSDLIVISNGTRISKYYTNDDVIINMLTQGPIAIAVSAVGWQSYSSGVYRCPANSAINHAVLLVGFTSDYWIIKNSWGADWGQSGFIYVTRSPQYNCGVGTAAHMLSEGAIKSFFSLVALLLLLWIC